MSRLSKVLILIVIGLNILAVMQSCNSEQNTVQEISIEDRCVLAKSHISACMLNDEKHMIYFPEWENYCRAETPEKLLDMSCEEIKDYYFGD